MSCSARVRLFTRSSGSSLLHKSWSILGVPRRNFSFHIPQIERLTSVETPNLSDETVISSSGRLAKRTFTKMDGEVTDEGTSSETGGFTFPVRDEDRGVLNHGVSMDARSFIAEAEEQYQATSHTLHQLPGGEVEMPYETRINEETGELEVVRTFAAPFSESYTPSFKARIANPHREGELEAQRLRASTFKLDAEAELNVRKERQLEEVLTSPMPLLPKIEEMRLLLKDFINNKLSIQPGTAETMMLLLSHGSKQLRFKGISGASTPAKQLQLRRTPEDVPLLDEMRALYRHQKMCFVAPTPLLQEHLMLTLSAVQEPNQATFQVANRILLDCDHYVTLPTRTTYAAYFSVCHVNNAMPFAIARMKDAVMRLNISMDAAMATALLKGLNELGFVEEAVALLGRLEHIVMTVPLLNASLETLLLSKQPLACFSAMEATRVASIKPSADTYTLLLLACEQSGQWSRVTQILGEMQKRKVKGNTQTLNLLLKGLLKERLWTYAEQLHTTMQGKGVEVWPALEGALQQQQRSPKVRTVRAEHGRTARRSTPGRKPHSH